MTTKESPDLDQFREVIKEKLAQREPGQQVSSLDPISAQQLAERKTDDKLKRTYAYWFICILLLQLVIMNVVMIAYGLGCLKFTEYSLHLYIAGTLLEIFGIVLVITRYLFKRS